MKKSALFVSLITLGIANLAFVISYFTYLGDIFHYYPGAGIITLLALLLSFAAIIYVVIGLVKCKDASYNPSSMIFGGYGFFIVAFMVSRYAITVIEGRFFLSLSLVVNFLFLIVILIMMVLVSKNSKQYKGNKKYLTLTHSRLCFLSSFAFLVFVFLNLISMFIIKDVFYFNRLFTIVGYIFLLLTSILVLVGYSGYVKERGVLPNDKDEAFINPKPKRQVAADDPKEVAVKNAMEQYGMTREEAEIATGYNKSDDNPISQLGLPPGLGLNVQQAQQGLAHSQPQPQSAPVVEQPKPHVDNSAEIAELKREYLQGKITKEEFNQRLAELKK